MLTRSDSEYAHIITFHLKIAPIRSIKRKLGRAAAAVALVAAASTNNSLEKKPSRCRSIVIRAGDDVPTGTFLKRCFNLVRISLRDTLVFDVDVFRAAKNLREIDFSFTPVRDLSPLSSLPMLIKVSCKMTDVNDLMPLACLDRLEELDCSYTMVSDVSPLKDSKLKILDVSACSELTELTELPELLELRCNHTRVSRIDVHAKSLAVVECQHTLVDDVDALLVELERLERLDCSYSRVRAILAPIKATTIVVNYHPGCKMA